MNRTNEHDRQDRRDDRREDRLEDRLEDRDRRERVFLNDLLVSTDNRNARAIQSLTWPIAVLVTLLLLFFFSFSAMILGFGRLWGALDIHMQLVNRHVLIQEDTERETAKQISSLENRVMDLDRRLKELNTKFLLLEDYTRGRIHDMPYHPPPSSKGQ